ncbi:MAG TPA: hypothetical protein DCE42_17210 [Myxococcales bacterium]|nr:hypothetical protein [Deltaproteobacteria bacterium]MBU49887.1 hypothetical protein [Deltaproteobacteria bacterium]HAA56508.1 hypothetical protein [Myxococcales bacterium]
MKTHKYFHITITYIANHSSQKTHYSPDIFFLLSTQKMYQRVVQRKRMKTSVLWKMHAYDFDSRILELSRHLDFFPGSWTPLSSWQVLQHDR